MDSDIINRSVMKIPISCKMNISTLKTFITNYNFKCNYFFIVLIIYNALSYATALTFF